MVFMVNRELTFLDAGNGEYSVDQEYSWRDQLLAEIEDLAGN